MSDKMRWRYGDTNPVVAAVDAETVIDIGDLVYQETDDVRPASSYEYQGSKAATQDAFVDKFLGVAMQRSRSGESSPIRVATTGVFESDSPSNTVELGDLMGPDENATPDGLLSQQVVKVDNSKYAVGRVARREPSSTTSVLLDIRSTIMTGGVEGGSPSGV
jgi:hypothetical protein